MRAFSAGESLDIDPYASTIGNNTFIDYTSGISLDTTSKRRNLCMKSSQWGFLGKMYPVWWEMKKCALFTMTLWGIGAAYKCVKNYRRNKIGCPEADCFPGTMETLYNRLSYNGWGKLIDTEDVYMVSGMMVLQSLMICYLGYRYQFQFLINRLKVFGNKLKTAKASTSDYTVRFARLPVAHNASRIKEEFTKICRDLGDTSEEPVYAVSLQYFTKDWVNKKNAFNKLYEKYLNLHLKFSKGTEVKNDQTAFQIDSISVRLRQLEEDLVIIS